MKAPIKEPKIHASVVSIGIVAPGDEWPLCGTRASKPQLSMEDNHVTCGNCLRIISLDKVCWGRLDVHSNL